MIPIFNPERLQSWGKIVDDPLKRDEWNTTIRMKIKLLQFPPNLREDSRTVPISQLDLQAAKIWEEIVEQSHAR